MRRLFLRNYYCLIRINADSDGVTDLFSSTDGVANRLDTLMTNMLSVNGTIESRTGIFEQRVDELELREANMESQLERIEARMRARFTALDVLVSNMTSTSNFLTQQLAGLNG